MTQAETAGLISFIASMILLATGAIALFAFALPLHGIFCAVGAIWFLLVAFIALSFGGAK